MSIIAEDKPVETEGANLLVEIRDWEDLSDLGSRKLIAVTEIRRKALESGAEVVKLVEFESQSGDSKYIGVLCGLKMNQSGIEFCSVEADLDEGQERDEAIANSLERMPCMISHNVRWSLEDHLVEYQAKYGELNDE